MYQMRDHFSTTNIDILSGVSSLLPEAPTFLKLEELKTLCIMLHQDVVLLNNEIEVLKPMLKKSKSKNIIDLYFETTISTSFLNYHITPYRCYYTASIIYYHRTNV